MHLHVTYIIYLSRDFSSPPPTHQTRRYPQARRNYPPKPTQKVWYVPEVYKMTKAMDDWRKMGKKSIFDWDFCMEILEFSQKFQILICFRPNAQRIVARFRNLF